MFFWYMVFYTCIKKSRLYNQNTIREKTKPKPNHLKLAQTNDKDDLVAPLLTKGENLALKHEHKSERW